MTTSPPFRAIAGPPLGLGLGSQLLERIEVALEARSPGSCGHARRVSHLAARVARELGLPAAEVACVGRAAAVHDLGKIVVSTAIVNKPGRLAAEEYRMIKGHAAVGAALVARATNEKLATIVRHHHERFDGLGYPDGLIGLKIPIGSRIIAVADTFDAIISDRPYRRARSARTAIEILRAEAGAQLDPEIVAVFCETQRHLPQLSLR